MASAHEARAEGRIVVGYQTGIDPAKAAQAAGSYECVLGAGLEWHRFATGPSLISALASGDIDIGNLGSVPLAAALSKKLPLVTFLVSARIRSAEALVVRQSMARPEDLRGKTIATPFGSTSHVSLLGALRYWGISPRDVRLVHANPADISAGWQRGDLDGAFVWSPALSAMKRAGHVLVDAGQVADWGVPTFEVWVARKAFAQQHPDVLRGFASVTLKAYAAYRASPVQWTHAHAPAIATITGAPADDIAELLRGASFPELADQSSLLDRDSALGTEKTALFLLEQNAIRSVLTDYQEGFSSRYLPESIATQDASWPSKEARCPN